MAIIGSDPGGGGETNTGTGGGGGEQTFSFRARVLAVITTWLVGGLWSMSITAVDFIQRIQNIYIGAFGSAGDGVLEAFRKAGDGVLEVETSIGNSLVEIGASTGLAGPIATAIVFALVMFLTATIVKAGLNALKWIT